MPDVVDRELIDAIAELHRHDGDPFGLFVEEALRFVLAFTGHEVEPSALEEDVFEDVKPAIAAYLRAADRAEPFADVLGPAYSEVASRSRRDFSGQFFTPWAVSVVNARLNLGDWTPGPNPGDAEGLWRMLEPAVGCGSMLLAFLTVIVQDHGPEALRWWAVEAWDVDRTVARACALQVIVTLLEHRWGLGELLVLHGDTIRYEVHGVVMHAKAEDPAPAGGRAPEGSQLSLFPLATENAA